MNAKKKNTQQTTRKGEGEPLGILRQSSGGSGVASLDLDLSNLPVPERRYTADVAGLLQSKSLVRMLFGQTKVDGIQIRSMLDVHFSMAGITRFLNTTQALEPVFEHLKLNYGVTRSDLTDFSDEPNQTIGLTANIVMSSCSEWESCLDFYQISPFSIAAAQKGGGLSADQVVRVSLPTDLFMGMIESLKLIVESQAIASGEK